MLIVKVRVPSPAALRDAIAIAHGYVVSMRPDPEKTGSFIGKLVLREEAELEKLGALGVAFEVVFDSRTAPDPKADVGQGDRYAEKLERLRHEKGKA